MKVGILSMQRVHNYGSFLQAFSLKIQLEKLGHDVFFIDIEPGKQIVESVSGNRKRIVFIKKHFDKYFCKRIEHYFFYKIMNRVHKSDCEKYLKINKVLPQGENFDVVIIGSDEVFNAACPSSWGFTTQLFGNIKNAHSIITYAASCGQTDYKSVVEYGIIDDIRHALKNVKGISVRDENTANFIWKITGVSPRRHVDPVFLSDFDAYIQPIRKRKPFLLVYSYPNRINEESEIDAIKCFAKDNNLEIVCVGMFQKWCNKNIVANAFELLSYVKDAKYVITDTFHGTVFSIKYNKKFAVLIRDSNSNKLTSLLEDFGLESCAVNSCNSIEQILKREIKFDEINNRIKDERNKALAYFKNVGEL